MLLDYFKNTSLYENIILTRSERKNNINSIYPKPVVPTVMECIILYSLLMSSKTNIICSIIIKTSLVIKIAKLILPSIIFPMSLYSINHLFTYLFICPKVLLHSLGTHCVFQASKCQKASTF